MYKRHMVNRVLPAEVLNANDGTGITLDDWSQVGNIHALVLYSPTGRLIVERKLETLLTKHDLVRVRRSVSSRHWRYYAESPTLTADRLLLALAWCATFSVNLRNGSVAIASDCFPRLVNAIRSNPTAFTRVEFESRTASEILRCEWASGESSCKTETTGPIPTKLPEQRVSPTSLGGALAPLLQVLGAVEVPSYCAAGCIGGKELRLFIDGPSGKSSYSFVLADHGQPDPAAQRLIGVVTKSLKFGPANAP